MHTARRKQALKREHEHARAALRRTGKTPIEMLTVWTQPMFVAFGIECLIKAIWLKQGNQLAGDGRYVPMIPNEGHRLMPLCRAAEMRSVSWSSQDDNVIENLIVKLNAQLPQRPADD
jgi:hypothetical protein